MDDSTGNGGEKMVSKGNFLDFCEDATNNRALAQKLIDLVNDNGTTPPPQGTTPPPQGTTPQQVLDFFITHRYHGVTIEDCVKIIALKGPTGSVPVVLPGGGGSY